MLRARSTFGAVVLAAALLAATGCSSGSDPAPKPGASETAVPTELGTFLSKVAKPGTTPFTAAYEVLQKLGGGVNDITVESSPPAWRITAGDVVVIGGPDPVTCRISASTCRRGIDESALSGTGIFSGFLADATAQELRANATKAGASAPTFGTQTVGGVALDCAVVATGPVTACLTPQGVFGLVDDPTRRAALTNYATTAPTEPISPPFPPS
ncbi:MAG TPA: hypothetical protein VGH94_11380 [Acidimicrobiales bacterium]